MKILFYLSFIVLLLTGCTGEIEDPSTQTVEAYVPVYYQSQQIHTIAIQAAKPIVKAGKQYVIGNLLMQNEINEGIHFIDVSNPASPRKISFLSIPLSTEIAVKDGYLYTNNYDDLVVYDIRVPAAPQFVKRIEDVFPPANQDYPPFFNVAFECPNPKNGVVVGWELKSNLSVKCRR